MKTKKPICIIHLLLVAMLIVGLFHTPLLYEVHATDGDSNKTPHAATETKERAVSQKSEDVLDSGVTEDGYDYRAFTDSKGRSGYLISWYSRPDPVVHVPAHINGVPVIAIGGAFKDDVDLVEVTFPETVKTVYGECFFGCENLKRVDLGGIESYVGRSDLLFWGCRQLESLSFKEGATLPIWIRNSSYKWDFNFIEDSEWNHLKCISIPSTMTEVPKEFFYGDGLETIEIGEGHPTYRSMDGLLYSADGTALIVCGTAYPKDTYTIPEGVSIIERPGFDGCTNLKTLVIPKSVTEIRELFYDMNLMLHVTKGSYGEEFAASKKMEYRYFDENGSLLIPVTGIELKPLSTILHPGRSLQLEAVLTPQEASDKEIMWKSSNPNVVEVSENGLITAKNTGSATVSALAAGGYSVGASCSITVKAEETKKANPVIHAENRVKVYGDGAFYLGAFVTSNGKLTYQSNNTKVATVNRAGRVTLKGPGKATITITAAATTNYNAASKNITITVKPKKATLKKAKSTKKRTLKVMWKRDTKATGYQVVIAQNKKFKKGKKTALIKKNKTTSRTFKKLKSRKNYYYKVRAYKQVGKTKLYGAYSKTKRVKVR